jgi:hypothetical protein
MIFIAAELVTLEERKSLTLPAHELLEPEAGQDEE